MIAKTMKMTSQGVDIEMVATVIEMPWGSIYWLVEAHMERPILPQIFRRVGELSWVALEPSQDAAFAKMEEYIAESLK